jgi:hypothetical protein
MKKLEKHIIYVGKLSCRCTLNVHTLQIQYRTVHTYYLYIICEPENIFLQ